MMNPIISIVIANYNYGRFIEDAIRSVVSQDGFDQCELIVVDGGSSDNSVEVIKKYANRIAWWVSERDKGQSDAFNKGFAHARGLFLTWLNADDILTSGAIRVILREIAEHPQFEWFTGSTVWTDSNLRVVKCFCAHRFSHLRAKYGFLSANGPSSIFSRRLLKAVGGVDEGLHYVMDTDLWYKFYRQCGVTYRRVRYNFWAYRKHEASKTSGADDYASELALENRRKARAESKVIFQRYGLSRGPLYKFFMLLTISPVDFIISAIRSMRLRGVSAMELNTKGVKWK